MKKTALIVTMAGMLVVQMMISSAEALETTNAQNRIVSMEDAQMNAAPYFPEVFPIYVAGLLLTVIIGSILLASAAARTAAAPLRGSVRCAARSPRQRSVARARRGY